MSTPTIAIALFGVLMLVTGSANTLLKKAQNMAIVNEETHETYKQPVWQVITMFCGEFFCLFVYLMLSRRAKRATEKLRQDENAKPGVAFDGLMAVSHAVEKPSIPLSRQFLFALPALCDCIGTTLNILGLLNCAPSVYQMLRGFLIIVTSVFTVTIMKKHLHRYKWFGALLITSGLVIVGVSSMYYSKSGTGTKTSTFGVSVILIAQLFSATQFVIEEKILTKYSIAPIKAVGLEGFFGLCLTAMLFPLAYYAGVWMDLSEATRRAFGIFNPMEGLQQTLAVPSVAIPNYLVLFSVSSFNITGMAIARMLSSAARSTIDATRTVVVWFVSVQILQAEPFIPQAVPGFLLLTLGTFIFNDIIQLPFTGWSKATLTDKQRAKAGLPIKNVQELENRETGEKSAPATEGKALTQKLLPANIVINA